ncbi:hypothetical protein [Caballeronia cordobensis]|uniref:hypothetical protein n=1 Tax=Caballeronia cordobensis TaxID=1353886 RepID=UPI00045EFAB7|nr:hypothetical protein BRPE67_BCDS11400 [Burkholderia sp. RPE67]
MQSISKALISRRQQSWKDAHEKEQQLRTPDLFGWWLAMRVQGCIDHASTVRLGEELGMFNAVQVAALPLCGQ